MDMIIRNLVACFFATLLGVASLITSPVVAQPPGGGFGGPGGRGGMMGGFGNNPMFLLANDKVRAELDIVDDQMADLEDLQEDIREEMRDIFSGLRDATPEERQSAMQEMQDRMKTFQEKLDQILLPHQQKRLKQLFVQFQSRSRPGGALLGNEDVKAQLKITPEQETQLEEASRKAQEEMAAEIAKLQQKMEEKVIGVLSSEQQAKYRDMVGEMFDFGQMFRMGGGRGPGGPGGGRGGNRNDF